MDIYKHIDNCLCVHALENLWLGQMSCKKVKQLKLHMLRMSMRYTAYILIHIFKVTLQNISWWAGYKLMLINVREMSNVWCSVSARRTFQTSWCLRDWNFIPLLQVQVQPQLGLDEHELYLVLLTKTNKAFMHGFRKSKRLNNGRFRLIYQLIKSNFH